MRRLAEVPGSDQRGRERVAASFRKDCQESRRVGNQACRVVSEAGGGAALEQLSRPTRLAPFVVIVIRGRRLGLIIVLAKATRRTPSGIRRRT